MYKKIFTIVLLSLCTTVNAQPKQIVFDHYGLEAGFFSREAMAIVTTPDGMVWVSSNDGLARFDGKRFKFYQHIPGDTNSLLINYCTEIQSDKRGLLWLNSGEHLEVFNPHLEKFNHIKLTEGKAVKKQVYSTAFYYDSIADLMWITTKQGLYFSKAGSFNLQSAGTITKDKRITDAAFYSVVPDSDHNIWLTSYDDICKLNTQDGKTTWYKISEKLTKTRYNKPFGSIACSYLDDNKVLWLGTFMSGLIEFNTITQTTNQYFYKNPQRDGNSVNSIIKVKGQEDVLWISASGNGFTAFNTTSHRFTSYSTQVFSEKYAIKGNTYGLFNDKNDIMWIGSETGLHKYDLNKQLFNTIDLTAIASGTILLPVDCMAMQHNLLQTDEILWLHIPYKGSYRFNFKQQKILPLPQKIAKYLNPPTGVFNIYIDKNNILWIATNQYGLIAYDIVLDKIVIGEKEFFYEYATWTNYFFTDNKNNFWIGTYDGLYMIPTGEKNIIPAEAVNSKLKKEKLSLNIQGITQDEKGVIWFTADNSGKHAACIGKFYAGEGKVEIEYNEKDDLYVKETGVDLREIVCDNNNDMYVSFYGSGIGTFPGTNSKPAIRFLSLKEGINSAYINYLQKDARGNIWCSTAFGLSCFKPEKKLFVNFSHISFGLENTINAPLFLSPNTGNLYIGQHNAIKYCNADFSSSTIHNSNLLFSELKLFNKPYRPNDKDITDNDVIRFRHFENMISIEFALLSFTNAEDNTYSWKLKGLETDWNISKNNIASYSGLKPGTYTLLVKAANSQGDWVKEPIELTIKISPPFYQTWWFTLLCIMATAVLVYWLVQQRINRIKERYRLRNKIAADLHDEIGSTLTSISILSSVSQQAIEQQPQQAKEMMQQISTQSKTIQQNMSDIVWSIRPDNEKTENLVIRMREFAAQTLEPLNINTSIVADDNLVARILPMQYRKDILLIYKEAINNIAKHANASSAKIVLNSGKNKIVLRINDNGVWKGNNSGTGTKSMQERAKALGATLTISSDQAGTQILLVVPIP